jgi:nucleoside-diphosphate-sugar epimerase
MEAVRMARKKMWVSDAKARAELGWNPAPAETALERAVEWFGVTAGPEARCPAA